MPSSDLNDYIHLQKEIKRLKEDNTHLMSENRDLLNKVKTLKLTSSGNAAGESSSSAADDDMVHDEKTINELKQEIFVGG
jgi:predicted RNase H-like nuclease (RuvC/YqgF family)